MSKQRDPEDSVHMRLLGNDLEGSTAVDDDDDNWPSHTGARPFLPLSRSPSPDSLFASLRRRRVLLRLFYGVLLLTISGLVIFVSRKPIVEKVKSWRNSAVDAPSKASPAPALMNHSSYVAGQPGARFRDNLVNGTNYITAWPIGGFTNQVIAQINLIYLAVIALRIPVMADFIPGHMHGNPGFLPVSKVYDLPRLSEALRFPILEWNEFKNRSSHEKELIGCWSTHATIFNSPGHYGSEHEFTLEVSLTPVPDSRHGNNENWQNIMALASLGWPEERARALQKNKPLPSPGSKEVAEPDETMLCFDELYYADSVKAYEWVEEWVPMWTQAGKYMRWAPDMEELARYYIHRAFGLGMSDPFPSYISVHIRHTDFASLCQDEKDPEKNCFAPLSAYAEKIDEIKAELLAHHGENIDSVLVTSDEESPEWWATVIDRGWHRIDWPAEKTEELYSEWYPIVLDSVALSLGKGFVGTVRSTLSLLAAKRVQDWEHGFVRMVTFG